MPGKTKYKLLLERTASSFNQQTSIIFDCGATLHILTKVYNFAQMTIISGIRIKM